MHHALSFIVLDGCRWLIYAESVLIRQITFGYCRFKALAYTTLYKLLIVLFSI